eukprot:6259-Pleurochrysis_carterae.AAC.2
MLCDCLDRGSSPSSRTPPEFFRIPSASLPSRPSRHRIGLRTCSLHRNGRVQTCIAIFTPAAYHELT